MAKKVYCSKFTSKELLNSRDVFCNWSQDFITKEEMNIIVKKNIIKLGKERFSYDQKYLNARVSWENDDDDIEVGLWGKNLLDNDYIYKIRSDTASTFGTPFASIRAPLTFGIDVKYKF